MLGLGYRDPRLSGAIANDLLSHSGRSTNMRNEFTTVVEQDGPWYVAYCAEVPGANGQGLSHEECLDNLRAAIALILEHRRDESLRAVPLEAKQELVVVG